MKKFWIVFLLFSYSQRGICQSQEVQQLLLDVEKLAQFKQILSDLKKGYEILSGGYEAIKNISKGNFNLHQVFLDGLLQVSPVVQRYARVADIISYQQRIVKDYRSAFNHFKADKNFTVAEMDYIGKVYSHLFTESLSSLDDLITVVTTGRLRMSDEERLDAIDRIWEAVQGQWVFLRDFNNSTALLAMSRQREQEEVSRMKAWYDSHQ